MKHFLFSLITLILLLNLRVISAHNDQPTMNKKIVMEFYNQAINEKNFNAAARYLSSNYVQHNPLVGDGVQGLRIFITFLRNNFPQAHSEIKKILADGDYVVLQVHSIREPGTRGRAIFDLFKLKNGKITEHWDSIQDIPATSANSNTMF